VVYPKAPYPSPEAVNFSSPAVSLFGKTAFKAFGIITF
jgi:hypothetical protein